MDLCNAAANDNNTTTASVSTALSTNVPVSSTLTCQSCHSPTCPPCPVWIPLPSTTCPNYAFARATLITNEIPLAQDQASVAIYANQPVESVNIVKTPRRL